MTAFLLDTHTKWMGGSIESQHTAKKKKEVFLDELTKIRTNKQLTDLLSVNPTVLFRASHFELKSVLYYFQTAM